VSPGTWRPEWALNGMWVCVRYREDLSATRRIIRRDVYQQHGEPVYYAFEDQARRQCETLEADPGGRDA
jgi:hypothetical protein